MMRIVLLAPNPMSDYVGSLASSVSEKASTHLFSPLRFDGDVGNASIYQFPTGKNKYEAIRYFFNPYLGWKIWQRIVASKPDIIHLVNGEGYPWSILWAGLASFHKIPFVVTLHDPEVHPGNLFDWFNEFFRPYTLRKATRIHIHTNRFIKQVTALGVSNEKITIIPHGSIAHLYTSKAHPGIQKEPNTILFFGRLEAYKGLDFLIQAALAKPHSFRFIIAGSGQLTDEIYQKIASNPDIFEFHNGWLSKEEVAKLFQRATICALPYKQATQSSLPLLAAAFQVPVVATPVGAFIDDVPTVNGVLFQPNDVDAFWQAINEALEKSAIYDSSYEFDALSQNFIEMYQKAIYTTNNV